MSKETIKRKIDLLKEDLAMQVEGSVASDSLMIEIEYLKSQLKSLNDEIHFQEQ